MVWSDFGENHKKQLKKRRKNEIRLFFSWDPVYWYENSCVFGGHTMRNRNRRRGVFYFTVIGPSSVQRD